MDEFIQKYNRFANSEYDDDYFSDESIEEIKILWENKEIISTNAIYYIKEIIQNVDKLKMLTFIEYRYIVQAINGIEVIDQFQVDYLVNMIIKYGKKRKGSNVDYDEAFDRLVKLTYIFFMFNQVSQNEKIESEHIATFYRCRRFVSLDTKKLNILYGLFNRIDTSLSDKGFNNSASIENTMRMFVSIQQILWNKIITSNENTRIDALTFSKHDFKDLYIGNIDEEVLSSIIDIFVINEENIPSYNDDEIYMNTFESSPFLKLEDKYLMINYGNFINSLQDNCYFLVGQLYGIKGQEIFNKTRDDYLEEMLEALLKKAFPEGKVYCNSEWDYLGQHGENDSILILDEYALIFEAKAGKVNIGAKQGIMKNNYGVYKKLIMKAALQGENFKELIKNNLGKTLELKIRRSKEKNVIDLSNIKYVYNFAICLSETPLQNMQQLLKVEGRRIPVFTIYELNGIFEVLNMNSEKIDYLIKRYLIEDSIKYIGEEEDFLKEYCYHGFNNSPQWYKKTESKCFIRLDKYKDKPFTIQRELLFNQMIEELEKSKVEHWLHTAISLLEISHEAQKQIIRDLPNEKQMYLFDSVDIRKKALLLQVLNLEQYQGKNFDMNKDRKAHLQEDGIKNALLMLFNEKMSKFYVKVFEI